MGTSGEISKQISSGILVPIGQLRGASNGSLLCKDATEALFVYKPVVGERPLWDFPNETLSGREVAAANMDSLLGWHLVPPTCWIEEGPLGPGMVQSWVEEIDELRPVNIFDTDGVPEGWRSVLQAIDQSGRPVTLAHEVSEQLQRMALFDAVVNNADRKAGHVLADSTGQIFAIDHGLCFNEEPKLRTVLWGWANHGIPDHHLMDIERLQNTLGDFHELIDPYLDARESVELRQRIVDLLQGQRFPQPHDDWPAIPWPVF